MTTKHSPRISRLVGLAVALASVSAPIVSVSAAEAASAKPSAQPAPAVAAATATNTARSLLRANVEIDLCALAGSTTMPNAAVIPVWGYQLSVSGVCPATLSQPGGPILSVTEGDSVTITLHNSLPEATSLLLQGQAIPPDITGAAASTGTATYTFTASKPGTFLYEAGFVKNAVGGTQRQVAMGLYGALIVRPVAPLQAYDTATTAYKDEGVLVLGEIDTALNLAPNKAAFDMRNFKPKYSTINGKAYAASDPIVAPTAGDKVLLRFVNAGISYHSMSLLGGAQKVIAYDGNPLTYAHTLVAETIGPGQTLDSLVDTTGIAAGSKLAVYDANLLLNNSHSGVIGNPSYPGNFGGMLTFINVGTAVAGPDVTGPATSSVTVAPSPTNGTAAVTVTANVSDVATGGSNVAAAEYFIDTPGTGGTGLALSGTFGGATATGLTATIPIAAVLALSSGNHTVYVHGQDSVVPGNWGSFNFATLNVDKTGPLVTGLSITPNPSNGTADVAIHATASDGSSGGGTIAAAEYTINGGTASPMIVNYPLTSASVDVTIPAATVNALVNGSYAVTVRARDNQNNWGAPASINLVVDKLGPVTSAVSASPSSTNGLVGYNTSVPAVRIFATATDAASSVSALEGFIGTPVGANGTGFVFFPMDTGFNSPVELAYADIPLTTIVGLPQGIPVVVSVHAKDSVGNWGATATTTVTFDTVGPTVSGLALTPPAGNNQAVTVSAAATDVGRGGSNIASGEYFIDAVGTPADGTGAAMAAAAALPATTISASIPAATVTALSTGNHTVTLHAKDAAGNWGLRSNITLLIDRTAPTFTGITLAPSSILLGTASVNLNVNGANDPAPNSSGVAGGEYFIGAVGTPGNGTAFTGLTAPIPTGSLAAATYVISVRIRDAAGNWSTVGTGGVRTATLTVTVDTTPPTFSGITLTPSSMLVGTAATTLTVVGATDPGTLNSGVTGGEYFTSTVGASGTGTAFTGPTASIPTGSLAAGSYVVSVRIRDAAGNWSTVGTGGVRTATLVVFTDAIFADGFDSPTTLPGNWSTASTTTTGRLNVTATAAQAGGNGLQAQGNNTNYVQENFAPAASTYDARFYVNPNGNTSTGKDIFAAATTGFGTQLFHVRYRLSGVTRQVQIQVGATANGSWTNLTTGFNRIEVVWQAVGSGGPTPGSLVLYVNGVSSQTLTTTSTGSVGAVRFGSVTNTGNATLMFFDSFASKRSVSPLIGP